MMLRRALSRHVHWFSGAPRGRVARRVCVAVRRVLGPGLSVVLAAGGLTAVPGVVVAARPAPAKAAGVCSGSVLVFPDSVNGGSSSAEAAEATALGCSVTMFSSSAVSGMTQGQMEAHFGGFSAIII